MNTKLHTLCDNLGRPVRLLITEGQRSDFRGADALLKDLPRAKALLGDKGYDSDKIRAMLADQGITPCIPPKRNRKTTIEYCKSLYKKRHKVENLFAKLKDWRRIATRYDRCAHTFRSAIYLAATVIFWL
jgi:transposase